MNKKAGIFAILLLYCCLYANGYTDKKAILQLSLESQPDTLGYNYVSDFATDAYVWIANGQVVLWDSPEKKLAINITDLKDLEAKSNALFTRFSNVFIYETWTSDKKKSMEIASEIQSGSVYINTMVKSDPRIPFGGIKHSGFGRELSDVGMHEFVNVKTICVA